MILSALVQKAINAATNSNWQEAIELNEKILALYPHDLDTLNRLARACFEVGDFSRSKKIYHEVLAHDPYNIIALKNLKRFHALRNHCNNSSHSSHQQKYRHQVAHKHITSFIEEPGKTKVVQLVRVAEPHVLFRLHCGEQVFFETKSRGIHIYSAYNAYIGRLPDDLSYHMQFLMKNGYKYEGFIKQIQINAVFLFIREVFRSPEFSSRPSFSYHGGSTHFDLTREQDVHSSGDDDTEVVDLQEI